MISPIHSDLVMCCLFLNNFIYLFGIFESNPRKFCQNQVLGIINIVDVSLKVNIEIFITNNHVHNIDFRTVYISKEIRDLKLLVLTGDLVNRVFVETVQTFAFEVLECSTANWYLYMVPTAVNFMNILKTFHLRL